MSVTDEALVRIFETIQRGQSRITEKVAALEATVRPIPGQMDSVEKDISEIKAGMAAVNGLPKANQERLNRLWKWIGLIGGVGFMAGGAGSLLMEFIVRRMLDGGP